MSKQIVQDWLVDCAALSPVELHSFASSLKHNDEVINALCNVFDNPDTSMDIISQVCDQFFTFHRSRETDLQQFTLQFLPSLIYIYLNSIACGKKKSCSSVETLLIGVYNLEVVDENGQPVSISFRMPSLAQASIYHEPMNLAHASLTEAALRRLEECNVKPVSWGPLPQVETLNSQNRLKVITGLLFVFNRHIGCLHKTALENLCKISSR
ncbi:UNVERIFIED_CONTAM: hypothetical protein PYX00_005381 [Menopon gallinae]|uniref:Hyccin n=1 Tax=Menopon gallinae TaxID=328185 RepID=A0AAW2HS36_9NEOP